MENSLLILAQSDQIIGWLTPVWVVSLGISFGLILAYLVKAIIYLLTLIPGLNSLNDKPNTRIPSAIFMSVLVMSGITAIWLSMSRPNEQTSASDWTLLILLGSLVSISIGFGLIAIVSRKRFFEVLQQPAGNFTSWLTRIGLGFVSFALLGILLAVFDGFGTILIVEKPFEMFNSLGRLSQTGSVELYGIVIQPHETKEIDTDFFGQELKLISFRGDQDAIMATRPPDGLNIEDYFEINRGDQFTNYFREVGDSRIPGERIRKLFVKNESDQVATIDLRWSTDVEHPQMVYALWIGLSVLGVFLSYWMFCAACPKISAIAISTFKTEITQPIFALIILIGSVFAVVSIYIPYYTFGEDIKMYKMSALPLIRILGIFMAIWAAGKSVAEEIEGRTALTVLSKPVGRRQFILGKFSGISLAIGLLFIVVGLWFIIWLSYKPIYDARETSVRDFAWTNGFDEIVKIIPGLVLAYLESVVFVAISI
ncbi:MAG TPA: ABC transporter permease subunit, partial [Pirellulaceae bacterium]|nr:ABC transporter permease subunit [Pirellulaceae bacterium]